MELESNILNLMIKYEKYNSILFNRFYLSDGNISEDFNIFHFGKCNRSYLLLACECDNLNIVKFLLENKVKSNKNVIYFLQINAVVEYCLKNSIARCLTSCRDSGSWGHQFSLKSVKSIRGHICSN